MIDFPRPFSVMFKDDDISKLVWESKEKKYPERNENLETNPDLYETKFAGRTTMFIPIEYIDGVYSQTLRFYFLPPKEHTPFPKGSFEADFDFRFLELTSLWAYSDSAVHSPSQLCEASRDILGLKIEEYNLNILEFTGKISIGNPAKGQPFVSCEMVFNETGRALMEDLFMYKVDLLARPGLNERQNLLSQLLSDFEQGYKNGCLNNSVWEPSFDPI